MSASSCPFDVILAEDLWSLDPQDSLHCKHTCPDDRQVQLCSLAYANDQTQNLFSLFPFFFSDLVLSLSPILFVSIPSSAPEPGMTRAQFPAFLSLSLSSCYSPSQALCGAQMHSVFFLQFTRSRCQHSISVLYKVPFPGACGWLRGCMTRYTTWSDGT